MNTHFALLLTRKMCPVIRFSNVQSCILDAEVVAFDKVQEKILPFQILSTRKRKAVASEDVTVDVCIYAFDLCVRFSVSDVVCLAVYVCMCVHVCVHVCESCVYVCEHVCVSVSE